MYPVDTIGDVSLAPSAPSSPSKPISIPGLGPLTPPGAGTKYLVFLDADAPQPAGTGLDPVSWRMYVDSWNHAVRVGLVLGIAGGALAMYLVKRHG